MTDVEQHRLMMDRALQAHGLGWDAWPAVVVDPRLSAQERLSAVLVLLASEEGDRGRILMLRL